MYKIVKRLSFCYGHRLMDYEGKCAHPHGHNGIVELVLAGPLDEKGMVCDFTEVKHRFADILERIDHRMLLREDDPLVKALIDAGEEPVVMKENPTAENLARWLFDEALGLGLPVEKVRLWETPTSSAEYEPVQGGGGR